MAEQKSWVQKILSVLTGGDEGKLTRFEKKLKKYHENQIQMRNNEIETLEEKIEDAKETLKDKVESVNLDKISTADGVEGYCKEYTENVMNVINQISEYEDRIDDLKAEIGQLEKVKKAIWN